jgi:hypothetical protein
MPSKTLLYFLAQGQEETTRKMNRILLGSDKCETGQRNHVIPNSVKLLLKDGELIVANPLLLSIYSDYFLTLFTSNKSTGKDDCAKVKSGVPCHQVSCADMNLILELVFKGQVLVEIQELKSFQLSTLRLGVLCNAISTYRYGLRKFPSYVSDEYFGNEVGDFMGTPEIFTDRETCNIEENTIDQIDGSTDNDSLDEEMGTPDPNTDLTLTHEASILSCYEKEKGMYHTTNMLTESTKSVNLKAALKHEIMNDISFLEETQYANKMKCISGANLSSPSTRGELDRRNVSLQPPDDEMDPDEAGEKETREDCESISYKKQETKSKSYKKGKIYSRRIERIMGLSGKVWTCNRCSYWHYNKRQVYNHQNRNHKVVRIPLY